MPIDNAIIARRLNKNFSRKYWKVQRRMEAIAMYSMCIDASLQNIPSEHITAVFNSIHDNICDYGHRHAFVVDIERCNWQEWEPIEQDREPEIDIMEQEPMEQQPPEQQANIMPIAKRMLQFNRKCVENDYMPQWAVCRNFEIIDTYWTICVHN